MIYIEQRKPEHMPYLTSIFVKFDYKKEIYNLLKQYDEFTIYYNKKNNEYELPITYLKVLIENLSIYDDIQFKPYKEEDETFFSYNLHIGKTKLFDYQKEAVNYGLNKDNWLLLDAPGLGKALSLDTPILTTKGFKPIKDITLADILYDENGNETKIKNIYNHINLNIYRITFSDGVQIKCCEDHLWEVWHKTNNKRNRFIKKEILKTTQIIDKLNNCKERKFYIPRCEAIKFNKKDLPIHPYVLGCLLGDGGLTTASVTLSSADNFIINKVNSLLPKDHICVPTHLKYAYNLININNKNRNKDKYNSNLISIYLKELKLKGTNSHTKFIPEIYKYSNIEDRINLLQGLLDTDGWVSKDNLIQYTSVSKQLIDDVRWLVESLGGIVSYKETKAKYKGKVTGDCYNITIKFDNPSLYVSLPRKKDLLKERKFKPRRRIISIDYIGQEPGKCLEVDSPSHLFIIDHFIVTHNTLSAIQLQSELRDRKGIKHCLVVCGINSLKFNWKKEIEKHSYLDCVILGQKINRKGKLVIGSLEDRINHLNQDIKEFFIIINVESLRNESLVKVLKKRKDLTEFIVFDEIHVCKDSSAQQSKGLNKLESKYKLGMTGTLLLNNPIDLHAPLKWIGVEKSCLSVFSHFYCVYGGPGNHQIIGYKNLDLLKEELSTCSLRRTSDILDLPEHTIITETLEMETAQEKFYKEVKKGICEEVDKVELNNKSILGLVIRLRQATALPSILTTSNIESIKIKRAVELTKEIISNNEKVVIFSTFKDPIYKLADELKEYNPLVNTGDIKDEVISNNIDLFQTNPNNKIFLGTISKVGTGITLTAARYMIFIDSAWTDGIYEQNWRRIIRIGQKNSVFIYNLITKDTIDEKVYDILKKKKALSEFIIDDNREDGVMAELQKYLKNLKN